ncbi:DUF2860 domain-containing protein [Vibrio sp. McD22-P3]|uniref:DUF2860 domain-containing protein n=1 Tax=Vibrio sp. McD22-P3 TaxID=2724880 RepID=UPI001F2E921A|nr:DUF2860 domain-containing protein [Vibrio sp. McD22-P3]MCF4176075.1 DUF2860 domain-containing protein [Vibrio sp. McD22-P3]
MKQAWSVLAVSLGLVSQVAVAKLGESNGFSGEIALNAAYASKTSNLTNTDDEFRNYTGSQQEDSGALVLPLGSLQYTFGAQSNHQLFLGTSRADIAVGTVALEAGYKYLFRDKTRVSVSFLPTILEGEVWQDPYTTDTRNTTKEKGNAYRLQLDNIAGSLFSLDLAYGKRELDEERSGTGVPALSPQEAQLLSRNADILYGKFKMMLPVSQQVLLYPALIYTQQDADGNAMKHNTYGAELSSFMSFGNHKLALTLGYSKRDYDAANPIYDKTRGDDEWKAFLAYEYPGIFYSDNLSLVAFAGATNSDSNIDFYDEKDWITAVGLNWKF